MTLTQITDAQLRDILQSAQRIAVVGHSDDPGRPSYQIAQYLRRAGYTVYPVNPTIATVDGERVYPSLAALPVPVDIVDVFRRSEYLADVVKDAIAIGAKVVWAQLGVSSDAAAHLAAEAGITLIQNNCIKVTHMRVIG